MLPKLKYCCIFLCFGWTSLAAQYLIKGKVLNQPGFEVAHLDVLDNWDEFNSVSDQMVLKSVPINDDGTYRFSGNELSEKDGFYRVRFTKKEVGVSIQWRVRNYVNFIFNNQDTILLDNVSFTSGRPENQKLEKYTDRYDTYWAKHCGTDNTRQQEMLTTKYQEYCLAEIEGNDGALANTFLLASSQMDITAFPDAFDKVVNELKKSSVRPTYHSTLNEVVQLYSYRSLEERLNGWKYLAIAAILLNMIGVALYLKKRKAKSSSSLSALTKKETEVLTLIKAQKTNKEIAAELFVSEATIKTHINNVYRKLQVNSRQEALRYLNS